MLDGEAANGGVGAAATVKFSKRAAGCLSGTYSEGEGSLLSALAFSYMRSLDSLQQVADCAYTAEVTILHLVLSKNGGICCYSAQSGSAHLPLYPVDEGQPAIRPLPSPDKGPFCAICFEGPRKKPVPVAVPESPSRVKT